MYILQYSINVNITLLDGFHNDDFCFHFPDSIFTYTGRPPFEPEGQISGIMLKKKWFHFESLPTRVQPYL